jgi:membrane associated rhomboid family serine protease
MFPPFPPVIRGIIIANVAVQLFQLLAGAEATYRIQELFALDPERVLKNLWLWQPLTYMFLHHPSDIFHLLFNMLMLYMFGGDLAQRWGGPRFLRFYLVCGTGAGLITCLVNLVRGDHTATIGASGAIFGLLMAFGMIYPNRIIYFFMLFPMTARVYVAIFAALQLYFIGAFSRSGVAYFAHLGGMVVAWFYLTGWWDPRRFFAEARWRMRRRKFRTLTGRDPGRLDDEDTYRFH